MKVRTPPNVELPTLVLTGLVYVGWLGMTLLAGEGHLWAWPVLVVLLTLHGSLQHEHIHGHPTRHDRLNALLGGWPLSLWLPYSVYARTHREHHASTELTDPAVDPESFYVTAFAWERTGSLQRLLLLALQTLLGRLVLGPAWVIVRTWWAEVSRFSQLPRQTRLREAASLVAHVAGAACVLAWLILAAKVSWLSYLLLAVYPALSLTLLRSFAEHRPSAAPVGQTVVVESHLGNALFLFNNLHAVHHDAPGLPWYRIRARWAEEREAAKALGVPVLQGYRALWPLLVSVKDSPVRASPVHPHPIAA